jgi:hypothetical protein
VDTHKPDAVGFNAQHEYISNDATIGQGLNAVADAFDLLMRVRGMGADTRAEMGGYVTRIREAAALANAGVRKEPA